MHPERTRRAVLALVAEGLPHSEVSRRTGVPRSCVREWVTRPAVVRRPSCPGCEPGEPGSLDGPAYAHLLGLYLGDGWLSAAPRGVYVLRIACCDAYPRLMDECEASMRAVWPTSVTRTAATGYHAVTGWSKHWPCFFPQHGPGRKHERPIVLEPWQREVVERHPGRFLRGLLHSDGCRVENWTERVVAGQRRRYAYPRYLFTNVSDDIRGLCCWAMDLLGVEHRRMNAVTVSVARRASVAVLEEHVGPKS